MSFLFSGILLGIGISANICYAFYFTFFVAIIFKIVITISYIYQNIISKVLLNSPIFIL